MDHCIGAPTRVERVRLSPEWLTTKLLRLRDDRCLEGRWDVRLVAVLSEMRLDGDEVALGEELAKADSVVEAGHLRANIVWRLVLRYA